MLLDECKPAGCLSCLWFASNRSEPGFPCKCYNMQMAPEGVSSAKGPVVIGSPLAGTMLAVNTSDTMTQMARLCGAPKDEYAPNHRSFETQNQVGGDDAGGELDCARSRFRRWSRPRRRQHA